MESGFTIRQKILEIFSEFISKATIIVPILVHWILNEQYTLNIHLSQKIVIEKMSSYYVGLVLYYAISDFGTCRNVGYFDKFQNHWLKGKKKYKTPINIMQSLGTNLLSNYS